jgi:hypothetical protein
MLASGRLSASTVPVYCRSINRPESHRQPCPAAPPVLVSPSPAPIPRRKATGRRLDPTSSNLTPRPNPHRARGTDAAPTFRDFVPWRFSDAGRPSRWRLCHRRRPKTCTNTDIIPLKARSDDRPLSPPWRAGHQRVVSFRVEPNIAAVAAGVAIGRLGAAMATTHPIAIRRLTISTISVDLVPVQPAGLWPHDELASATRWQAIRRPSLT